jgi:hypothetical protein
MCWNFGRYNGHRAVEKRQIASELGLTVAVQIFIVVLQRYRLLASAGVRKSEE